MFQDNISSIPPPSGEAVQSILETIKLLKKGDRERAARRLEGSFRAASPLLHAMEELRFLNDLLSSDPKGEVVFVQSRMKYDWVYYADAALRLDLVDLITDSHMLDAIRLVRSAPPEMETVPKLSTRYRQFQVSRQAGRSRAGSDGRGRRRHWGRRRAT